VSGHEWEEQRVCVTVSWTEFCVCRSPVWRCSWWSLDEAWCNLGCTWDSLVWTLDFPSKITTWSISTRLQRRGWRRSTSQTEVTYTMQIPWKADSLSPEMTPKTLLTCKWAAWEQIITPSITHAIELERFVFTRWFLDFHINEIHQTQKDKNFMFAFISWI
jgi:hypothetical protein